MSRYLLDTCTLILWASDPASLWNEARAVIADIMNQIYVSSISAIEIAIKRQLGKLNSPPDLTTLIIKNHFIELPLTIEHANAISRFPLLHKDPFDRTLVAQASIENLTIISRDRDISKYEVLSLAA